MQTQAVKCTATVYLIIYTCAFSTMTFQKVNHEKRLELIQLAFSTVCALTGRSFRHVHCQPCYVALHGSGELNRSSMAGGFRIRVHCWRTHGTHTERKKTDGVGPRANQ